MSDINEKQPSLFDVDDMKVKVDPDTLRSMMKKYLRRGALDMDKAVDAMVQTAVGLTRHAFESNGVDLSVEMSKYPDYNGDVTSFILETDLFHNVALDLFYSYLSGMTQAALAPIEDGFDVIDPDTMDL
jgi:hypothetical protein